MIYFLFSALLIVYLELLGQSISRHFHLPKTAFSFGIGLLFLLAFCYVTTSFLSAMYVPFALLALLYGLYFIASLWFIARNFHQLWWPKGKDILFLLLIVAILSYYSYQTSLGDPHGFDSTFYLNLVTGNIGLPHVNTRSPVFGTLQNHVANQYVFQSFYYLGSFYLFICEKIANFLNLSFWRMPAYVWGFNLLFYGVFADIVMRGAALLKKNKVLMVSYVFLLVFVLGKLYFNNIFGFYGNSYRTMLFSYAGLFLLSYFTQAHAKERYLYYVALLAACSVSSSATFAVFFALFAFFFVAYSEKNLLREYAFVLFYPLLNILFSLSLSFALSALITAVFCLLLYFAGAHIQAFFQQARIRYTFLTLTAVTMILLSYSVTKNLFDFRAFFESNNGRYDMTIDYFRFTHNNLPLSCYQLFCLFSFFGSLLVLRKEKLIQMSWILILVFFNPFCCSFLNAVNPVYYRSYDIFINPLFLAYWYKGLIEHKVMKNFAVAAASVLFLFSLRSVNFIQPSYFHSSFVPGENYDPLQKMNRHYLAMLRLVKEDMLYKKKTPVKIITEELFAFSNLPQAEYLFSRESLVNPAWSPDERQLYNIFYPTIYTGDPAQPQADYAHMCHYLQNAGIDYLIIPKSKDYAKEDGSYLPFFYEVNKCLYPVAENEEFLLYKY